MRGNIPKLYVANLLTGLVFWYGIEKLFMYSIGITAFGVSISAVVLVIITSLFDVPFGVLADRWSRKYTLCLGIIALGLSSWILGSSDHLAMYLFGTAIYGFYLCMTSGTFQAITYDSLQEEGKQHQYAKHQGGSYGLFLLGIAISSPVGGFMAHSFGYRSTYYWTIAVCAVDLLVLLSLREPKFHKLTVKTKLRQHIGEASRVLVSTKTLLYLSALLVVTGLLRNTLNEYAGLYFIAIGFGAIGSGFANGGKWLFNSVGQFLATKLARLLPLLIISFFVAFAVMSTWRVPLALIFFYVSTFTYGVIQNETQAMLQDGLDSGLRATALSLVNFGTNSLLIPLGLAFGWITEHYDVFRAYQLFAVIGVVYLIVWLFWRKRIHIESTSVPTAQDPQFL